jgi:probable addiction module antidote protein
MSKTATARYDVAEHLRTPEEMAAYLEASIGKAKGDAAFIAKGMAQVARDAGLSRESLYKALSGDRSPGFATILKVVGALRAGAGTPRRNRTRLTIPSGRQKIVQT